MTAEFLVPLIVGVLGLIFKEIQAYKEKRDTESDTENKLQELRKPLATNDTDGIHSALSNQHDRVLEEIRRGSGW